MRFQATSLTKSVLVLGVVALVSLSSEVCASTVDVAGSANDKQVGQLSINPGMYDENSTIGIGILYDNDTYTMVEPFPLPYLAPGQTISSASISFYVPEIDYTPFFNCDLYGLKRTSTTSDAPIAADWYVGNNDTANTLLKSSFLVGSSAAGKTYTYTGANLASFLQTQYASFGANTDFTTKYVFFRLNPTAIATRNGKTNYYVASSRNNNPAFRPVLSITMSGGVTNVAGRLQFSFSLPQKATTSAGVYNPTTGVLIRTLWNNVAYEAGVNTAAWDGNDDSGNPVSGGSNYQIKLIYHNVQYIWDGTVGNTSLATSGANVYKSFLPIVNMAAGGGKVYIANGYNEGQSSFHYFSEGAPQVPSMTGQVDVQSAFGLVAADATHSYWAKTPGGISSMNTFVVAINNSNQTFYPFPAGSTGLGSNNGSSYAGAIDIDTTAGQPNPATGLAVQQSGNLLFVAHGSLNTVRVFDKTQGTSLGSFSVPNPGLMATTANGDVWVISNGTSVMRYTYNSTSRTATLKQTISSVAKPIGVAVSPSDATLLIADGGSSMQIKAFNNSTGAALWTYGQLGGMAVNGPGVNGNTFDFTTQTYIAFQTDGTFWVGDNGNMRVVHLSISGNTVSYVEQIAYTTASYQTAVDLTDTTRVFNQFLEYSVDYTKPLGGTNGSWKLVRNWAYGLPSTANQNYFGFGNGLSTVVTMPNGLTFGLLNNFANSSMDLVELPANGQLRFTGAEFKNNPRLYEDGSLRYTIVSGSTITAYEQPFTGCDSSNNPHWGSPIVLATSSVSATDPVNNGERTELTSGGVLVSFSPSLAAGFHLGGIKQGGSSWLWRSSSSTTTSPWFPRDGHYDIGNGVQYAGNVAMALGHNIVYGYHGEFWGGNEASQWLNFYDNGLMVGLFGTLGMEVPGDGVAADGFAGNSFAPTLVRGADGTPYIYSNDESNHGGIIRWHISGWNQIQEISGTSTIGSTATLGTPATAPAVNITSPPSGSYYLNGVEVLIGAQVTSQTSTISKVQFFDGSTSLGVVTVAPYTFSASGLAAGTHTITAVATDANGNSTTSSAVTITVGNSGINTPPSSPTISPISNVSSTAVTLNWTIPTVKTTSSTLGQIVSYQVSNPGDTNSLLPTETAGAPTYAAAKFNLIGSGAGNTFINPVSNVGQMIPNLEVDSQAALGSAYNSVSNLSGTAKKLFCNNGSTQYNTGTGITVQYVPFALYDVVVYSLPNNIQSGTQTSSVTLTSGFLTSVLPETFTALPTSCTVTVVPTGSGTPTTNINTTVFQGITTPSFKLLGNSIAGFQIVERPYDSGTPTQFTLQRSTNGVNFTTVSLPSGTASGYQDSGLQPSTTYYYRLQASNSYGTSSYSPVVSITTPSSSGNQNFSTWQSAMFTQQQLATPSISGPTAVSHPGGMANLLAYSLGVNPLTSTVNQIPKPAIVTNNGASHLQIMYTQPATVQDVTYLVQVSSDLSSWFSGSSYTSSTSTTDESGNKTVTVTDLTSVGTVPHRYMRLQVQH